jgi:hypothetical protein
MAPKNRKVKTPRFKAARAAFDKARAAMTAARRSGNVGAQNAAEAAMVKALDAVTAVHRERFEAIAAWRMGAAVNQLEELGRLCNQRRYPVTANHARVMLEALDVARKNLEVILAAAVQRGTASINGAARRQILFGPLAPIESAIESGGATPAPGTSAPAPASTEATAA